ncbi:MAG: hypothetical protein RR646_08305 [Erysipelotrichaceae bacterium]
MNFLINAVFGFLILILIINLLPALFGIISFFVFIYLIYSVFRMLTGKPKRTYTSYTYTNHNQQQNEQPNEQHGTSNGEIKGNVIDVEYSETEDENN